MRQTRRPRVRRTPDPQRRACYDWEAAWSHEKFLEGTHNGFASVERCTQYVKIILNREGMAELPSIRYTKRGTSSHAVGHTKLKFLVREGDVVPVDTILHELAHVLDSYRGRNHRSEAGHGPTFIGIYITLLVKYAGMDKEWLESRARRHGVRVSYDRTGNYITPTIF